MRLRLIAMSIAALSVAAPAAAAEIAEAPRESTGQAQAVVARIVPFVGLPGVTTSIGLAGAQVGGGSAQATATAADFGLLGALASAGAPAIPGVDSPSLPQPITADSAGVNSVEREQLAPPPSAGAAPPAAPGTFARERADATEDPLAARSRVDGPQLVLPGLIELSSGHSAATALANRSESEVTYGRMVLGAGEVVLEGLRWTATRKGAGKPSGGFTLGAMTVAGQSYAVDSPAEIAAAIAEANKSLMPFGLALSAPSRQLDAAGATVAPLIIQVRNPEPFVEPSRQGVAAIRPVLTPLVEALIAAYPDAMTAQIALNAVVGGLGGSGGGRLELGGVSARFALTDSLALPSGDSTDPVSLADLNLPPAGVQKSDEVAEVGTEVPGLASVPPTEPTAELTVSGAPVVGTAFAEDDRTRQVVLIGLGLLLIVLLAAGDRVRLLRAG